MWTLEEGKITLSVILLIVYIRLGGEWWNHSDQQVFISLLKGGPIKERIGSPYWSKFFPL